MSINTLKQSILDFTEKKSVQGFSKYNTECRNNKVAKHTLNINTSINKELNLIKKVDKNFVSAQEYYNEVLDNVHKIDNATFEVEVPVIYPAAEWKEMGEPTKDATKEIVKLNPKRIVASMTISKNFLHYHPENDAAFINSICEIVYDVLLKQMFSTNEATEDAPKGLFNGKEVTNITSANDLATLMSLTKCGGNGVFVMSPSAETKLLASNPNLYDNGRIFNRATYVIEGMEEDYIAYLDLSKIVLVDWNVLGVDIDPVTLAHQGLVKLVVNYYVNYSYLRNERLAVGKV